MNKAIESFKEFLAANGAPGENRGMENHDFSRIRDVIDEIGLIPYGNDLFSTTEFDDQLHPGYLMLEFVMGALKDRIEKKGLTAFVEEAKSGFEENDFADCYFMKCVKYAIRTNINADSNALADASDDVRSWVRGNVPDYFDVKLTFMYEENIVSKIK